MIYGEIDGLFKPLPRIIFGTLKLSTPDARSFSLLDSVAQAGCYALDTARAYGEGATEGVVGEWMEDRNNREEVLLIDKGAHPIGEERRVNPAQIRADLEESLRVLKTDYIDLYLLHRDDPDVAVGPILETLNDLQDRGSIILFGASNWSRRRLVEAAEYAEKNGLSTFAVSSNQYSLAVQHDDPYPGTLSIRGTRGDSELDWYRRTQFPLLAWSSLARGFFSGRYTRDNLAVFEDQQSRTCIRCYAREDNFLRLERAQQLAAERGATTAQIALAYVFHQLINCFAITGTSNPDHFRESIGAFDIALSDREAAWLDLESDTR
jgi:aryl-alcohol dehydrogenase-like predicted oxidoreductase